MSTGFIVPAALRSEVKSAPNRNDFQEYLLADKGGQFIGLTTLPPSNADCLKMPGASTSRVLRSRPGMCKEKFIYMLLNKHITKVKPRRVK
jgi:hypothetical protein